MHETALAAGILRIAREEARRHQATRITEIRLHIGLLSAVEAYSLGSCFALLAEGSLAQDASLKIANAPLPARCESCGHEFELESRSFFCPLCLSADIQFEGGHGCTIQSISVERAAPEQENPA